jgi:uncharacterized protein with HEPN domain
MPQTVAKFLWDVIDACDLIDHITSGVGFDTYEIDPVARAAVERQFEIIAEALLRARRQDPRIVERITGFRQIIDFRYRPRVPPGGPPNRLGHHPGGSAAAAP